MIITETGVLISTDPELKNPAPQTFKIEGGQLGFNQVRATGLTGDTTYFAQSYFKRDGMVIRQKGVTEFHTAPQSEALTILNTSAGNNTITVTKNGSPDITLSYSTDDSTWTTWRSTGSNLSVTVPAGGHVSFKGNNATLNSQQKYIKIGASASCSVSGDINTIISESGGDITLPAMAFYNLFANNIYIDCSGLILPSSDIGFGCYWGMFYGCTSLTTPPDMSAARSTSGNYAMESMFHGCTALLTAPDLSNITSISPYCYCDMFYACISLSSVRADLLPATTLEEHCYDQMFMNCGNLSSSPDLPAPSLATSCYQEMFSGCSSLNRIVTYATSWHTTNYARNWVDGVSPTGTFLNLGRAHIATGTSGIPVGWTESQYDYFHITNLVEAPNAIAITKFGTPTDITLEYSTDKENWTEWTSANGDLRLIINDGETVWFRGNNSTFSSSSSSYRFSSYYNISAGGNIMSLLDKTMQSVTIPTTYCFNNLFYNATTLVSIADLVFPATTLADYCYYDVFQGCTGITSIPSGLLPATTLTKYCYAFMFDKCTGLTSLPSGLLPATTAAESCYYYMFRGCTGLTSLPSGLLPATTLAKSCYRYMFYQCSSVTNSPYLVATSLVDSCYNSMFSGCSSLNTVTVYAQSWNTSYTTDFLRDVASEGSFYNLGGGYIPTGTNGIPYGWTEYTTI